MGCGNGVARFAVTLSLAGQSAGGSFKGCLDDLHLDPRQQPFVFPFKIWGTLSLARNWPAWAAGHALRHRSGHCTILAWCIFIGPMITCG